MLLISQQWSSNILQLSLPMSDINNCFYNKTGITNVEEEYWVDILKRFTF